MLLWCFCFHVQVVLVFPLFHGSNGFTILDSALAGHVFESHVNFEWMQCFQFCLIEARCLSYNFYAAEKLCELNDFAFSGPCEAEYVLIKTSGWIFHQASAAQDFADEKAPISVQKPLQNIIATITCDNVMEVFFDNESLGLDNSNWHIATDYVIPGNIRVLSIKGMDKGGVAGILGSLSNGLITSESWKCTTKYYDEWFSPDFDDCTWPSAVVLGKHGRHPWGNIAGISLDAKWIWTADYSKDDIIYCRFIL